MMEEEEAIAHLPKGERKRSSAPRIPVPMRWGLLVMLLQAACCPAPSRIFPQGMAWVTGRPAAPQLEAICQAKAPVAVVAGGLFIVSQGTFDFSTHYGGWPPRVYQMAIEKHAERFPAYTKAEIKCFVDAGDPVAPFLFLKANCDPAPESEVCTKAINHLLVDFIKRPTMGTAGDPNFDDCAFSDSTRFLQCPYVRQEHWSILLDYAKDSPAMSSKLYIIEGQVHLTIF